MRSSYSALVSTKALGRWWNCRGEPYSKRGEGVGGHFKQALVDPLKEPPKDAIPGLRSVPIYGGDALQARSRLFSVVVEDYGGGGLALQHFPQDGTCRRRALLVFVAATQLQQYFGPVVDDVAQGDGVRLRRRRRQAESEDVGEDDLGILAGFEGEAVEVLGEQE